MMIRTRVLCGMVIVCAVLCLCVANTASAVSVYDDAVAYWSFDEGTISGTTVYDQSLTTAIDLSLVGTFTYEEGAVDNAISSAATGNYLTTGGDVDALDLSRDEDFTISCWVKYASSCMIASKMESSGNYRGWLLNGIADGSLDFLLRSENDSDSRLWIKAPANTITSGEWAHVTATLSYDTTDALLGMRLYVNGQEVEDAYLNNDGLSTLEPTENTIPMNLMGRNNSGNGYGALDEVAIWKRALSATEVQGIYQAGQPPLLDRPDNYFTNGDFEDTTGWGLAGTTEFPAGWTAYSDRKNAAAQATGTAALGGTGTSAYMEAFISSDESTRRELRQYCEFETLPDWQFDMDFASATPYYASDRSLSAYLVNGNSGQIYFRAVDPDGNGKGDLQFFDSANGDWQTIAALENSIDFSADLNSNALNNHLTIVGHYDDETPNFDVIVTDNSGDEYSALGLTSFFIRDPLKGDGVGSVVLNTFLSGASYTVDNLVLTDFGEVEPIAGDANNDGKVDGSDVTILAGNWQKGVSDGLTAKWEEGDFNGDGKVDGSDVTILAGNWQYGVEAAAASVPEPATIMLLLAGISSVCLLRRR